MLTFIYCFYHRLFKCQFSATETHIYCTVSGNDATDGEYDWGDGGGIYNYSGIVTLTNCTVSGNHIDVSINIYNISGQLIAKGQLNNESSISITISNYRGAAIVSVITSGKTVTEKVIIW